MQLSEENIENLKRVSYVLELLYKESMLADKLRLIQLEKTRQEEEAARLAKEEALRRKKFVRL